MAKKLAMIFGVIVILVGLLGFISNPILGMFATGSLLNIIYIVFGIILIWASKSSMKATVTALKTIGILYLLFAIIGFASGTSVLSIFAINSADNWLHLVLALIFLYGGFMATGGSSTSMGMGQAPMSGQM